MGVRLIGIVGFDEKVELVKVNGVWVIINYCIENIVECVVELMNGKKVDVVYDLVGKSIWLDLFNSFKCWGLMVSFGNVFGLVIGVDFVIFN